MTLCRPKSSISLRYRVSVAGSEREFADDARFCDERAHAARCLLPWRLSLQLLQVCEKPLSLQLRPFAIKRRLYPIPELE